MVARYRRNEKKIVAYSPLSSSPFPTASLPTQFYPLSSLRSRPLIAAGGFLEAFKFPQRVRSGRSPAAKRFFFGEFRVKNRDSSSLLTYVLTYLLNSNGLEELLRKCHLRSQKVINYNTDV